MASTSDRVSEEAGAILAELRAIANPDNVAGMARFGINPENTLGIDIPTLNGIAKRHRRKHDLAQALWDSGIHEARLLAAMVDDPKAVTPKQMERWVADFDSWDICDGACGKLFDRTPYAYEKAIEWAGRPEEFVKRAGFVMAATSAVHDKRAPDERFLPFLDLAIREATDERNFVRKAVNWAVRQIGKRNQYLNERAIETARHIERIDSKSARWIARDALRELTGAAVQERLISKSKRKST